MKQAVLVDTEKFELRETGMPDSQQGEVLVKVLTVGVCGSDLHVYSGHHPKVKAPVVLGHECIGVVHKTVDAANLVQGTPVALIPLIGCNQCVHCKQNKPNLCLNRTVIGFQRSGALSDIISVPIENVIPLPKDFDLRVGVLYEPLAVIAHAVKLMAPKEGQKVIVTGAGTIGLLTAMYLRDVYGVKVTLLEVNVNRVDFAKHLGFEVVNNIQEFEERDHNVSPLVFECTGNYGVFEFLLNMTPSPSAVVIISTFKKSDTFGLHSLYRYETAILGSQMYTREDLEEAIQILSSPLVEGYRQLIVKKDFHLETVHEAYKETYSATDGVKVIIQVNTLS